METTVGEEADVNERDNRGKRVPDVELNKTDELVLEDSDSLSSNTNCSKLFWDDLTRRNLNHFEKFANTTATHGIRRIFTGKSKIRRLFWLLLFIGAAGGCMYNCIEQIRFLAGTPTSTRIEFKRLSELEFPAVTLCNNNFIQSGNMAVLPLEDYFECITGFTLLNFEERTKLFRNCSERLDSRQMNLPINSILRNGAQSAENFIIKCSWPTKTAPGNCSYKNFTEIVTNYGVCYVFNDIPNRLVARGVGRRFSLSILLDIQQYKYLNVTGEAGVLVAIHPHMVPPRPLQTGIAVPPGTNADISLRYINYTFPSQSCGGDPEDLNFFDKYNVPTCLLDKQYSTVADTCGCIDPASPPPKPGTRYSTLNYTDCTMSKFECVVEQLINATEIATCEQECVNVDFSPRVSYLDFPTQINSPGYASLSIIPPRSAADPRNNLVQLNIFYEDFLVQHIVEEPSYDAIRLLADIGGQLGLFLGVSVLSITEFLMWIFDEAKDRLLCIRSCREVRKRLKKLREKRLKSKKVKRGSK